MKLSIAIVALAAIAGVCFPTHAQKRKNTVQNEPAAVEAVKTIPATENSTTSPAAVLVVNSTADGADAAAGDGICETATGNGVCTFRAAVMEANAFAAADTITFASPLFDTGQTIILVGEVQITTQLTINGPGADKLSISGGNVNRVVWAMNGSTVAIRDLSLTNGRADGDVGAGLMISMANVTIERVHVKDSGAAYGGGIFVDGGALTMTRSAVTGNSAADYGGGLFVNWGSATVTGSTFSGNTAQSIAVAIVNGETLSISDSTITNNTVVNDMGGGIYDVGFLTIGNTIIAGNVAPDVAYSDLYSGGVLTSLGHNLVGIGNGSFNAAGDQQGTTATPLDAKLGPLGNSGGTTPTHSLLAGSPAIDAGSSAESTDQRGLTRVVDQPGYANAAAGADIGAFEIQASTAAPVSVSGRVTDQYGRAVVDASVRFTDLSGVMKSARTDAFGYYTMTELSAGESYVVTVKTRKFTFNPQLFSPTSDFAGLDLTAR